jgi:hypothetical protein
LCDTNYLGAVGKRGCVVGVGGVGWFGVGNFGDKWSGALSASFDVDLYGLSSCGCCVIVQSCSFNRFLEASGYV